MNAITNTTTLSNFATINQLALLRQLFSTLYLPTEVYEEISIGLAEGYQFYEGIKEFIYPLNPDGWLKLTSFANDVELQELANLPNTLHAGESACLAIARHRHWLFLTDDRVARQVAKQWRIPLSGSIGYLVMAVEQKHCPLSIANKYLQQMIESGYYSPYSDLSPLLLLQPANPANPPPEQ